MERLYDRGLTSVLVEGGAEILGSFLSEDLWDEIRVEVSPVCIDGKVKAPLLPQTNVIPNIETLDGHRIITYRK